MPLCYRGGQHLEQLWRRSGGRGREIRGHGIPIVQRPDPSLFGVVVARDRSIDRPILRGTRVVHFLRRCSLTKETARIGGTCRGGTRIDIIHAIDFLIDRSENGSRIKIIIIY